MKTAPPRPAITLIGDKVNAAYKDPQVARYRNNSMIEALPAIRESDEVIDLLRKRPPYDPEERKLPSALRFHCIETARDLFIPMPIHVELESRIACLIRNGYVSRNPLVREHWANIDSNVAALSSAMAAPRSRTMAPCMNVLGISGGGKTTAIDNILLTYPQVIWHGAYQGQTINQAQTVWLKITCPFDGSTKGLCKNFFEAIDDVVGTNNHERYADGRRTAHELLPSMSRVAAANNLGLLIVDEIQHLQQGRCGGREMTLNFFCELVNTMCLPILLIGTYKAAAVLADDFRQIRRGCGQGDFMWDAMVRDEVFDYFVEEMWLYQYTRKATPLTRELRDTIFDECQGVTDFCVRLYMLAQGRAISAGVEEVTPAIIRSVARDSLRTAQPVLRALREKDIPKLIQYDDVCPIEFKDQLARLRASVSRPKQSSTSSFTQEALATSTETPVEKKEPKLRVMPSVRPGEGLVAVAQQALEKGVGAYTALKAAGFIRSPAEDFVGGAHA
jgi:hypothetical protein